MSSLAADLRLKSAGHYVGAWGNAPELRIEALPQASPRACDPMSMHHKRSIRYSPTARGINVEFSQRFDLHITGGGLWLSAKFATSKPALAAVNCPRALVVIESTDESQGTETLS